MNQGTDAPWVGLRRGEEAAVREVFAQHGRMVYNACLRILGDPQAADDATQGAFLALLAKAPALPDATPLGPWLHRAGVLAARAQRRAERRRAERERRAAEAASAGASREWSAVRELLDEALDRLPAHEREAIHLTHLQGWSREEAAARLGVPAGTVASRVQRGLERLRVSLGASGTVLPATALGALLLERAGEAAVPEALLSALVQHSKAGPAAGAASHALAKEVLHAMFLTQLKPLAAWAALLLLAFAGFGAFVLGANGGEPSPAAPPSPPAPKVAAPAVDPDGFGAPVNGLAAAIRLDRAAVQPGKRVTALLFVRNMSDKPVTLLDPAAPYAGLEVLGPDGKSSRLAAADKQPFFEAARKVVVPPGETVFLKQRELHEAFDLARDGAYTIRYAFDVRREALAHLPAAEAEAAWSVVAGARAWTGRAEALGAALTVDPKAATLAGKERRRRIKVTQAAGGRIALEGMSGDSSLYAGQVVEWVRGAERMGRLRVAEADPAGGWFATPVPPLNAGELKPGEELEVAEEDRYWMRSWETSRAGKAQDGLKLVLGMPKTKLKPGERWKPKLELVNASARPRSVTTMGALETNLRAVAGPAPEIVACMGRGMMPERDEIDASLLPVAPGARAALLDLGEQQAGAATLGGSIGQAYYVTWKIAPGTYKLSFVYKPNAEDLRRLGLPDAFAGEIESNELTVTVDAGEGEF
ncbi:MAG: RNA polymerase sigma factor [Planctomycetota bacterium]|nr:RNA polymerase sigma factor [Planctomycetota bacterium]